MKTKARQTSVKRTLNTLSKFRATKVKMTKSAFATIYNQVYEDVFGDKVLCYGDGFHIHQIDTNLYSLRRFTST
jgi:hypothetical protein